MTAAVVILGIALIASIFANVWLVRWCMITAKDERRDLEDRVMTLAQPGSLVEKQAIQALESEANEPATISYVDETRQYELQEAGS